MATHDMIVIGTSEGGLDALKRLVSELPENFGGALFIVRHIAPNFHSILPAVLARAGRIPARHAIDGEPIRLGRIYVAPPDHHLLLERDRVRVTQGPKENGFRPAVDLLFRAAAFAFGYQVVGVILSGGLDDGTAGLLAIKDRGGIAMVQDPAEATNPSMPANALRYCDVDYCLPVSEIGKTLIRLSKESADEEGSVPVSDQLEIESNLALHPERIDFDVLNLGPASGFTCPECHGALFRITQGELTRYRCHTSHGFSVQTLLRELRGTSEDALWSAIRVMQEREMLLAHMAKHAVESGDEKLAELFGNERQEAQDRASDLRKIATSNRSGRGH